MEKSFKHFLFNRSPPDQNIFLAIKNKTFFLHALRVSLETLLSVYKKIWKSIKIFRLFLLKCELFEIDAH